MIDKVKFDSKIHHRRSIRLSHYDYAQPGGYFITICTQNRVCLFGEIVQGVMVLNDAGIMVEKCWHEIPQHFPQVTLDEYAIMPNHFHGIMVINYDIVGANNYSPGGSTTSVGANNYSPLRENKHGTSKTIGSIIRGFKIGVTKWCRQKSTDFVVWQRNYYERVIRDDNELNQIRQYVANNPVNWEMDENYMV
jgi:putative transposase